VHVFELVILPDMQLEEEKAVLNEFGLCNLAFDIFWLNLHQTGTGFLVEFVLGFGKHSERNFSPPVASWFAVLVAGASIPSFIFQVLSSFEV